MTFLQKRFFQIIISLVIFLLALSISDRAYAQEYDVGEYAKVCSGTVLYASSLRGLTPNDRVFIQGTKIIARTYATDCDDSTGTDSIGCYYDQHIHTCSTGNACVSSPDFYCVRPGSPPPCNSSNCSNCSISECLTVPGCSNFNGECKASTDTCRKNISESTCTSKGCFWNPTTAYPSGFVCESISTTTTYSQSTYSTYSQSSYTNYSQSSYSSTPNYTDTCTTAGLGGNTWSCVEPSNCSSGVYYASSTNPSLYACPSDKPQFCCKTSAPATETCVPYGVSCGASGNEASIVKSGGSDTVPFKDGQFCGGTYHDVSECTNNTTGEKRFVYNRVPSADGACAPGGSWCAVSTNPCQTRGGLMAGVPPVPLCGDQYYDSSKAIKTKEQGNPYCGKTYTVNYHCSDNTWEAKTTGFAPGICDAQPWCNTSTPSTGTGESCSGAPSAVGGNCPAAKPICNRSGTQGDCVAQASVGQGQFCTKASVCQSGGLCIDSACSTPITGGNPGAPTPQPLDLDIYCPTIDADGRPNTCYASSTCPTGYSLKSSSLAHQACSQHTSGINPYCCHKDAPTAPTPTAATTLDPRCPALDTDNRPNSCADVNACPAGYSHKSSQFGDSDCTDFRGKPSWCCHQTGPAN